MGLKNYYQCVETKDLMKLEIFARIKLTFLKKIIECDFGLYYFKFLSKNLCTHP